MKELKGFAIISAIALLALSGQIFSPVPAVAQVTLDPAHAGFGAIATWARDAGEPGQRGDPQQFGLYLQVGVLAPDGPYAGTRNLLRRPIAATSLNILGFDISGRSGEAGVFTPGDPRHGYCQGGAPRFVVEHTGGTCTFECAQGDKDQDANTNWWTISFVPPFTQYAGCAGGLTGTITYIDITFDELGNVVLDNIRVNNTIIGKPGR